jgi:hypothetical protein
MSGSDSGTAWAWWSYVGATALVVFLTGYRIVTAVTTSRERASRPTYALRSGPGAGPPPVLAPAALDLRAPHRALPVAPERADRSGVYRSTP